MIKRYFRSVALSSSFVFSAIIVLFGVCEAYEGIRSVGYGEKISAIEIVYGAQNDIEKIRILDFDIIC